MSVDDSGLESLRKSAEEITPGQKGELQYRVRITESALPDGAATEAAQDEIIARLDSILDEEATEAKQDAILAELQDFHADNSSENNDILSELDGFHTDNSLENAAELAELQSFHSDNTTENTAIASQLSTVNSNLGTLITQTDGIEGSLSSIDADIDVALSTRASEATLADFQSDNHTDLVAVQGKQDTGNASLASIDTKMSTLLSQTDGIEGSLTAIEGYTDGLETLITSTNTKLDTVIGHVDGLETLIGTTNTEIGATNETAASSDTATSGLNGLFKRLLQRMTTLIAFYAADFGASSGAIRTASQVGNATGAANFNSGTTGAQTLRTASNLYDGSANALTSRSYDAVRPLDVYVNQFGASTATHTRFTINANTNTQVAAANTARKWLVIINESGAEFFMKLGTTAVINQGFSIKNNTSFEMNTTNLYLGAINVIVGSNNRTIEVVEGS